MGRQRLYPSDLTDEQWEIIEPVLPLIPKHPFRDVVDAILYIDRSGCSWRQLPVDFPALADRLRLVPAVEGSRSHRADPRRVPRADPAGRRSRRPPSAGVIDFQSVKAADTVGKGSRGYDAGKKVNGRKRFIVTDSLGLLVSVTVLAASWQDRDGAKAALLGTYRFTPIRYVFADRSFAGRLVEWAARTLRMVIDIVPKPE